MNYLPQFYRRADVGQLFKTRNNEVAAAGVAYAGQEAISPNYEDTKTRILVVVDGQVDFIHADGALSVEGAIEDTRRTIEWLYTNIAAFTNIAASLDTHVPIQIFHPPYWVDRSNGLMPNPGTIITDADYNTRFVPKFTPEFDADWNRKYIHKLKSKAKKDLMLWPIHCLLGTPGYSIEPSLAEAILFWSAARQANPIYLTKGDDFYTEMYAIQQAEVENPTNPNTMLNVAFLDLLQGHDEVYILGQAKSHCVLETIRVMVNHFKLNASHMLNRIHLVMDCMSSVVVRDGNGGVIIDFEPLCAPEYDSWRTLGVNLVNAFENGKPVEIQ